MASLDQIRCPTCQKEKTWISTNPSRPFCSERCKLIDLGEWGSDTRKLPGEPVNPDAITSKKEDSND